MTLASFVLPGRDDWHRATKSERRRRFLLLAAEPWDWRMPIAWPGVRRGRFAFSRAEGPRVSCREGGAEVVERVRVGRLREIWVFGRWAMSRDFWKPRMRLFIVSRSQWWICRSRYSYDYRKTELIMDDKGQAITDIF